MFKNWIIKKLGGYTERYITFKQSQLTESIKERNKLQNELTKCSEAHYSKVQNIKDLQEIISSKINQVVELKKKLKSPSEVVKALTSDDFKFFDYKTLEPQDQKNYFDQAQHVLRMEVVQNEVHALNAGFADETIKRSKDFDNVLAMRHQISGIQLLMERLAEIPDPSQIEKPPATQPAAGI